MKLKLKAGLEEALIYIPFERKNVIGKFIDESLYPHLYKIAPDMFDVITEVKPKTTIKNDISINDTKPTSDSNSEGEIA